MKKTWPSCIIDADEAGRRVPHRSSLWSGTCLNKVSKCCADPPPPPIEKWVKHNNPRNVSVIRHIGAFKTKLECLMPWIKIEIFIDNGGVAADNYNDHTHTRHAKTASFLFFLRIYTYKRSSQTLRRWQKWKMLLDYGNSGCIGDVTACWSHRKKRRIELDSVV